MVIPHGGGHCCVRVDCYLLLLLLLQNALIRSLLEMVCVYYRKQAGIEEEEAEAEVRHAHAAAGAETNLYYTPLRFLHLQNPLCHLTDGSVRDHNLF